MSELDQYDRLGELAAAVADGRTLDWDAIESTARDENERASIRRLRAIAAIGHAHAELTFSNTGSESLSVRSLLQGIEDSSTPPTWGSLRILERVGRGRFGDVYRAWDPNLDREVALKLLRRREVDISSSEREVIEEGRLMARVRHPNVVTIHGAQRIDGRTGLWMEFVEGRTLEAELKERGPLPAAEVVEIGIQLCRALAAVHHAGLVHRDVKAQNVLRDSQGRVVLGDFGTGYDVEDAEAVSANLAGTPAYLAPEIFEGGAASVRSDIYSLGVLLFHLCTGTYPVPGPSLNDIRAAHTERRRTALATCRSDLPRSLTATIERASAAGPDVRYQSAAALGSALAAAMPRGSRERRSSNQSIVVGALAVVIGGFAWWTSERGPRSSTTQTTAAVAAPREFTDPPAPNQLRNAATSDRGQVGHAPLTDGARTPTTDESRIIAGGYTAVATESASARTSRRIGGIELSPGFGAPSRDGRLISLTGTDSELAVVEIASGRKWRLTGEESGDGPGCPKPACPGGHVWDSRFSRDGSRLTYTRGSFAPESGAQRIRPEIRTVATKGGPSSLIWRAPGIPLATPGLRLFHWAGDDDLILAGHLLSPSARELMIISTATGRMVASRTAPRTVGGATLSPDGRYVAYDFVDPSSGLRDIDIWTVGNDSTAPLIRDIASDRSPMWTSDGRYVLFISSRSGTNALWAHRMDNGRPIGTSVLVDPDIGDVSLLGTTDSGTLFVRRLIGGRDVYAADMDAQSVALTSQPRRLSNRSVGTPESPAWSPDGKYIAYTRRQDERFTIIVKSMVDGTDREFPQRVLSASLGKLQWEPGGGSLVFRSIVNSKVGLHRFTIETGQIATVWEKPYLVHEVLPQPGMVLFIQRQNGATVITLNNLASGEETTIQRLPANSFTTDLIASPRGDVAAYGVVSSTGFRVEVVDLVAPYKTREILSASSSPADVAMPVAWSGDDRELIVRRSVDEKGQPPLPSRDLDTRTTLWVLNLSTAKMRVLPTHLGQLLGARVSPDGRHIAMETGVLPMSEIWTIENALAVLRR